MDPLPNSFPSSEGGPDNYPPPGSQPADQEKRSKEEGSDNTEDSTSNAGEQDRGSAVPFSHYNATLQGGITIPQAVHAATAGQPQSSAQQPSPPWAQSYTAPYTAAMQLERTAATRMPRRDPSQYADAPPPLPPPHAYNSPSRQGMRRPNLQELASGGIAGPSSTAQGQSQSGAPPRYFEFQQSQHSQHSQAYRGSFGNYGQYPPAMPYSNLPPGSMQHPDHQGPPTANYPPMYQHQQYYARDPSYNPFPPPMYARERENPYWPPPIEGDSFSRNVAHHPQHSSSHGNAESFRFIRQINNNDVLCGRGGATNSHIGNRSFRMLVKQYKDKYLNAKKKEKPNVAGEIVDKIRSLDPPGRFLKKDRDTGYWLDIGDLRAKEKTSQALREGAPQIRKKMKEEQLLSGLASATDEEGGTSDTVSPEKSVASALQDADDEGKRKALSLMLLRDQGPTQSLHDKDDKSIPPPPKRQKSEDVEKATSTTKPTDEKDDDNASKNSEESAALKEDSRDKTTTTSTTTISSDTKGKEGDSNEEEKNIASKESTKNSNVDEKDLTQDQRDLYMNAFDPPRGMKQESGTVEKKSVEKKSDEGLTEDV